MQGVRRSSGASWQLTVRVQLNRRCLPVAALTWAASTGREYIKRYQQPAGSERKCRLIQSKPLIYIQITVLEYVWWKSSWARVWRFFSCGGWWGGKVSLLQCLILHWNQTCLFSEGSSQAWQVSGGQRRCPEVACQGCSGICFLSIMGKMTQDISVHAEHSQRLKKLLSSKDKGAVPFWKTTQMCLD